MKATPYLSVAEAIGALCALQQTINGNSPFLIESRGVRSFALCNLQLSRAGKAGVLHEVSRGGVPVVVAQRQAPQGDYSATLVAAIEQLKKLAKAAGDDSIPFLGKPGASGFDLCSLRRGKVGASDVFRAVSCRGRPAVVVSFTPPDRP